MSKSQDELVREENHGQVQRSRRSIKGFILKTALLFSTLGFLLIYLAADNAYQAAVRNNTIEASHQIAQTTFNAMYQLMQEGWSREQVERFLERQRASNEKNPAYDIEIYRGPDVVREFGYIKENAVDPLTRRSFDTGEPQTFYSQDLLNYTWPLKAEKSCLECHLYGDEGDVFGVIKVSQTPSLLLKNAEQGLVINLIYLAPLPFILSLFVIYYLNRRINLSIKDLGDSIDQIRKVSDLSNFNLQNNDHGFSELNRIYDKVEKLSGKMRDVAVDKELLEFEIELLEKFVITSEVVRDWREYISLLLKDINEVMQVYSLFSIFKVDDEMFALEIFWLTPPTERTKEWMESEVRKTLSRNPLFRGQIQSDVNHHVSIPTGNLIDLNIRKIQLQTKSLVLDKPKIGGIVGLGVHSDVNKDSTRQLVTNSILSTLINVVGSVKAIYKYTKDLEYYATRDPLTDLHNQRIFWELIDYEVLRASRHGYKFCVMMVDLDNFKSLNDNYGHSFGDRCLQEIGRILRNGLASGDFLSRYGGDEFAIILPESDMEQAQQVSQRIMEDLSNSQIKTSEGEEVDVCMSVGVAIYPDHASNSKELFMFADNMMYKAKNQGKNRVYIPKEEDVLEAFRDMNEKSLMISKAVRDKQMIPYFQPLVTTDTGEIKAVEVLCRMKTDNGELMGAHEFIEIAERMGIIHNLDFIMMEKALEQVNREGYQGLIFINISPRSLVLSEFIPEVSRIITEAHMERSRVVFEITERDTVKNMALLEKFVSNLKAEGFLLAVDDFGSGFSSFHYLKHFPIDFVKIEGEFVANMINNPKDHAVVRCIANLAHELKARTIAEYVESEAVLEAVRAIGINYAQGYHIRRPTPYILEPAKLKHNSHRA
ncbi:bifunctional diguanylate cyclase/phosphodiesterase [Motiliproteus sp. MSK22-1]|uniref:putative bifunctional diguanylate cyclase/phosphodiesterase n=1 Tax=Motiliproteus sp. MSK22-1 TaxID=1897630 RepID=UPI000976AD5B|nr:EAL domain-containing protein [Motiliproteus sp. MSK22-1]OMH30381.1 hypothetical protein BGP75_18560 [Motiliproteus sp. MSK22-1]